MAEKQTTLDQAKSTGYIPTKRKEMAARIGEFIISFSQLEFVIKWTIACLLEIDSQEIEDAVIGASDFSAACSIMARLFHIKQPGDKIFLREVDDAVKQCRAMNETRNIVAHGSWGVNMGARVVPRGKLLAVSHFEEPAGLDGHNVALSALVTRVGNLLVLQ